MAVAGLVVLFGLMATPARGQAVVERREGLSRADLFELGLYTPPKATPSRCQPRIDQARMKEVAKGIQKAFFFEGKESERIAKRWLLKQNQKSSNGVGLPFYPDLQENGTAGPLAACTPGCVTLETVQYKYTYYPYENWMCGGEDGCPLCPGRKFFMDWYCETNPVDCVPPDYLECTCYPRFCTVYNCCPDGQGGWRCITQQCQSTGPPVTRACPEPVCY